jgi:hypothetical protein
MALEGSPILGLEEVFMTKLDGWQDDPFGRHEGRYFSGGKPTNQVRDGNSVSLEGLPPQPPPTVVQNPPTSPHPCSAVDSPSLLPAGWYDDAVIAGVLRYWDGTHWTGDITAAPAPEVTDRHSHSGGVEHERPAPAQSLNDQPLASAESADMATQPLAVGDVRTPIIEPEAVSSPGRAETPVATSGLPSGGHVTRGPHYVVASGVVAPWQVGRQTVPTSIVTGEVPPGYGRVVVDCGEGVVIEATVIGTGDRDVLYFAAPVPRRVLRIWATNPEGTNGVFLDVSLLEGKSGPS